MPAPPTPQLVEEPRATESDTAAAWPTTQLNPRYTFDQFVIGEGLKQGAGAVPDRQTGPIGLVADLALVGEKRVREEDVHLLLTVAVEQSQTPGHGCVIRAQEAVQLGARSAADARQFRRRRGLARAVVRADADVEMPGAEINREVTVEQADAFVLTFASDAVMGMYGSSSSSKWSQPLRRNLVRVA